ncbi:hypothetical protein ACFLZP_03975 [Patescibacteria group bacterium]
MDKSKKLKPTEAQEAISVIDYGIAPDLQLQILNLAEDWDDLVTFWLRAKEVDQIIQFIKGEIIDRVAIKFGEASLEKFAQQVRENINTLSAYRRVARAFPISTRNLNVTWTHYLQASLTDQWNRKEKKFKSKDRFEWLRRAHDNHWSANQLAREIKIKKAGKDQLSEFDYHLDYLGKASNVLLHIKKESLTLPEKLRLGNKAEIAALRLQKHLGINNPEKERELEQKESMLEVAALIEAYKDMLKNPKDGLNKKSADEKAIPEKPEISLEWDKKDDHWDLKIKRGDIGKIDWLNLSGEMVEYCLGKTGERIKDK